MTARHTPGPWFLGDLSGEVISRVNKLSVAQCPDGSGVDDPQWRADARLIAAAPELAEACESILECASRYWANAMPGERKALELARAALKKAGRQP